ncbi:MAG: 6-carboxytetrahydropterin synthase QueD [Halothiobacillaceae bacterium]|nr:MAG: 6-carboxytetrahydropterin synthase QueD [Halothiobacillaceae bacterium]
MAAQYTLKVHAEFAAAHQLHGYPGNCARMHGHNWKVEVEVTGSRLNDVGMVVDFKAMKRAAREVAEHLDHAYLNDIPPFDRINPTAENIAAWFYQEVAQRLNGEHQQVSAVTLWETDRACVTYRETNDR